MEKVAAAAAAAAPPIFMHQPLSSSMAKKRDLNPNLVQHNKHSENWNPKGWDWDSVRFLGKPLNAIEDREVQEEEEEEEETLRLNLGSGGGTDEEPITSRPNKRVRSGSPPYPMCQVDNCKEDLSKAKDYHRRHKVCECHSKASKALLANQLQRFCQQCSRFHPLAEFDEGKRSCRRRLAGHNRRRRKTQPEDVTSRLIQSGNQENATTGNMDIFNLLTTLARAQGKFEERGKIGSQIPDRDQIVQILNRINSLPLPADLSAKLLSVSTFSGKGHVQTSSYHHDKLNHNTSGPLTMDLLAVLSTTLSASAPDAISSLSQKCSQSTDSEKSRTSADQTNKPSLQMMQPPLEFTSVGGERSSGSSQSPVEGSECPEIPVNLPLQLFGSRLDDQSLPKMASSQKYFSSDSSNPVEQRSPSSSPPIVEKQFSLHGISKDLKSGSISNGREVNVINKASQIHDCHISLDLFRGSSSRAQPSSLQSVPFQAGYTSSVSDHSPPSLNSDAQDRTGRIMFKLFDKDPKHLPETLRSQIYNWLSNSPSDMESYIRPGCVVLSIYVSMSSAAWEQLEENFLLRVHSLIQNSDSDFWRTGRFLVHSGCRIASHKDGKIRICRPWRTWRSPELISVSPLAVVRGQETTISLKGRNLSTPGTKIHCTGTGCYTSEEVIGSAFPGMIYDNIKLGGFKVHNASPGGLGRCFIEVENGFKGNSFPVIIADATICKELKRLESEFDTEEKTCDAISDEHAYDFETPRSREEVLHFLNELGWLFQREKFSDMHEVQDYSPDRFKFLLTFAVERNCCMLVRTLLDMLVDRHVEGECFSKGSLEMLNAIQLLSRAVKRRYINMVDLLIHYSLPSKNDTVRKYVFPPNLEGPGGITPLHLAACTSCSDGVIDFLTNDPQEIGLQCWESLVDANGKTPHAYAMLSNNHSYNVLVARKLAGRQIGQVSVTIDNEIKQASLRTELEQRPHSQVNRGRNSCSRCAVAEIHYSRRVPASQGLLQRPFICSMLAVAAVCVCVCLFLRGTPSVGSVAPFRWENLDYGPL